MESPMLSNILVPIDGSACAAHAFEYALGLAIAKRARLEICSYVDRKAILGRYLTPPLEKEHLAAATMEAKRAVKDAVSTASALGVPARGRVRLGQPAAEIIARAAATNADAIVIGTHGCSGFKRLFIGSVAEAVLRSAACPVIVIREKARAGRVTAAAAAAAPNTDSRTGLYVLRLVEVAPENFDRLYGEIATFMDGPGSDLPGIVETNVYGSLNGARILIIAQFRTHHDWVRAQWDARLGELLEEIATSSDTLEFDLYHGDRFPAKLRPASLAFTPLGLGRRSHRAHYGQA
jgi:nucleotide-binding universal stress UspA family protein